MVILAHRSRSSVELLLFIIRAFRISFNFFSRKIIQLQHLTILLRVKANPSMDDSIMHRTHKKYRLANCLQITPPCRLCSAAIIGRLSCFEREESWHRCWLVKHNFCLNGCFRRDESTCSVQPRAVCAIPEHMYKRHSGSSHVKLFPPLSYHNNPSFTIFITFFGWISKRASKTLKRRNALLFADFIMPSSSRINTSPTCCVCLLWRSLMREGPWECKWSV